MESFPYKKHRGVGVLPSQLTSGAEHSPSESQAADARLSRHIDASANSSMLFGFWYPAMLSRDRRAGAVARYMAHYGTKRVAKAVLIASVPPLMVKTAANPGGTPISVFDENRAGVVADRAQFFKDFSVPFYGYNRPSTKVSEGVRMYPLGVLTHSLTRIDSKVWRAYGWHGLTVGQVCHVSTCSWSVGTILGG